MTDRKQHLAWAKQRALEYVAAGDLASAISSMLSDIRKHPEWDEKPELLQLMAEDAMLFQLPRGAAAVRDWIEGWN